MHVVFGTGPLGRATVESLLRKDLSVRWVNRSGAAPDPPCGVELVAADAIVHDSAHRATAAAEVVYNCTNSDYSGAAFEIVLPRIWNGILAGAEASGARLVIGDNLYALDSGPQPFREDGPEAPISRKGRARKALADSMLQAHADGRVAVTIGRGSDFMGPWAVDQSQFGRYVIAKLLAGKSAMMIGEIDHAHSLTYVPDFGRALAELGSADETAYGRTWHVPVLPPLTRREMVSAIAREIGVDPKVSVMNPIIERVVGWFMAPLRELREMKYQTSNPYVVSDEEFTTRFGFGATPTDQAIATTVAWFKQNANP